MGTNRRETTTNDTAAPFVTAVSFASYSFNAYGKKTSNFGGGNIPEPTLTLRHLPFNKGYSRIFQQCLDLMSESYNNQISFPQKWTVSHWDLRLRFMRLTTSFFLFCFCPLAVQQTPVCPHWTDQPLLQRPAPRGGGHPADLRQVPWEEGRAERALWERPTERFLPS